MGASGSSGAGGDWGWADVAGTGRQGRLCPPWGSSRAICQQVMARRCNTTRQESTSNYFHPNSSPRSFSHHQSPQPLRPVPISTGYS